MVALVIFLIAVVFLEAIIIAEVIRRSKKPDFIFEIDDHDPDDVKMRVICNVDVKPGRIYFIKAENNSFSVMER